jgi:hypothetical protein
LSIW